MQTQEMLQLLKSLKSEARRKADALEKLVDVSRDLLEDTELDYAAFDDAICELDDKAADMSNFADDIESLFDDYAELLSKTANSVNKLVDEFLFPEDFRKFCGNREIYL